MKVLVPLPDIGDAERSLPGLRRWLREALAAAFVKQVLALYVTRIVLIGIGLATTVVVARILGPEGRGLYAVAMAIGAIGVQCGTLGLHTANSHFGAKDPGSVRLLLGNSIAVSAAVGVAALGVCSIAFGVWPRLVPLHGAFLVLALAWVPFGLAYTLMQNLLLAVNDLRCYAWSELANRGVALMLIGGLVLARLISAPTVFATGLFTMAAVSAIVLARLVRFGGRPRPSLALFRTNLAYGLRAYFASFFCFLVIRSDLLMLQYMRGAEAVGYYSIAATIGDYVAILPVVVASLLLPKLSSVSGMAAKFRLMKKAVAGTVAIVGPLLLASAVMAPWAIRVLFGQAFLPAAPAYLCLVPGLLFLSVHVVSVQFLNSIGYPIAVVWIWLASVVFKIAANLWAIPKYGISGAALASSVCYLGATALVLLVIHGKLHQGRSVGHSYSSLWERR